MSASTHPRGLGSPAMSRALQLPYGGTGGHQHEAKADPGGRLHQVAVSWTLANGVTEWRASCGWRTAPPPEPSALMAPGPLLDLLHDLWAAALADPDDADHTARCGGCYHGRPALRRAER